MPLIDAKEENKKRLDKIAAEMAVKRGVKSVSYDDVLGVLIESYLLEGVTS